MIKYVCIVFLAITLMACNKQPEKINEVKSKEIIVGDKILVANELLNKNLKISANNTNLSKDDKFYFQLSIQNLSNQPLNFKEDQIIMVDSKGEEYKTALIDRELISPIDPNQEITGIVAFDSVKYGKPKFIKFKEL